MNKKSRKKEFKSKKIAVIGAGYVGLVSGVCFAEIGHDVVCVDNVEEKVEKLKKGIIPIYEPGLNKLVKKNVGEGRLNFTTNMEEAVKGAHAIFIAVGTPTSRRGDGYADLSYVYAVAKEIAPHLKKYSVVVDKSTVPVGTARHVGRIIREENPNAKFDVASNPEFLREGAAIDDFMKPDRIVIGTESRKAERVLKEIYSPITSGGATLLSTTLETAELIKYAANSFLAVKISFINEMANICEAVGADVSDLAHGIGLDSRIGSRFLNPGPGYGGSCFPKDTLALLRIVQEHGEHTRIVEAAVEANAAHKARMIKKIREALGGCEAGKTIGFLGLTFKAETDDMRDSAANSIIPTLIEKGARVKAHDPKGMEEAKKYLPEEVEYVEDQYDAMKDVDSVVIMTEWKQYGNLDLR